MEKGFGLRGVLIVIGIIALAGVGYYYVKNDTSLPEENTIGDKKDTGNLSIDDCKDLENYKQEVWYPNFKVKIENLDFFSQADAEWLFEMNKHSYNSPQDIIDQRGKYTIENVGQVCYSNSGYLFAIIPSEYGGGGFKFILYDTKLDTINIAKREDIDGGKNTPWYSYNKNMVEQRNEIIKTGAPEQVKEIYKWFGTPSKFQEINQENIKLSGSTGDAGCGSKSFYNYSLKENYITIKEICFSCEGDEEATCYSF